ncbi:4479_t:CDS:2, partial [Funneliformis geosporum]
MNDKLDIKPLISTRNFLAEIIQNAKNDYEKVGAIQAFEVSFELTKNVIRKILLLRAQEAPITPKEIFRLAALEGLIEILTSLPKFLQELNLLITKLKELPECYTKGTARQLSDLDLCYQEFIPDFLVYQIEEEFKESDLPFRVELI